MLKRIAISLGDINGIGLQIALESHDIISKICQPIYCIDQETLEKASFKLGIQLPQNMELQGVYPKTEIKAGKSTRSSGLFSYLSFLEAVEIAKEKQVDAICTLPINKKSWNKAGIDYVGHTDMLRDIFQKDAIVMLGCPQMFVALFTEHIPLKNVPKTIKTKKLCDFLEAFFQSIGKPDEKIAVLGLNPHAGDNGVLGDEEKKIKKAIKLTNKTINSKFELVVPDIAFTPHIRKQYRYFVAMYHDQGLAPLKALHFEESINVSLNLPIIRTSVDHGTAFDKAYKNEKISNISYINAIKEAVKLSS